MKQLKQIIPWSLRRVRGFLFAVISEISNIYHNHPSGHVNPSPEDIELLKRSTLIT
ncbi:JAB domain-containing protein [Viridibacillus sp. FSL R5-0888]|uniref:JAB domain-containing protein n=1 Tax=unclassified Viridibacillus TaxID=2617942 RepID=UPI004040C39E